MSDKKQLFNRKARTQNTADAIDLGDGTQLVMDEPVTESATAETVAPTKPTKEAGQRGRPKIPTAFTITDGPKKVFDVTVGDESRRYSLNKTRNITRAEVLSVAYKAIAAGYTVTLGPVAE